MYFQLQDVVAGYGSGEDILKSVSLEVEQGELVCLIGPNGAGKSTVLRAITGLIRPRAGRVLFQGKDITGLRPDQVLGHGICMVPQGHSVFPEMSVWENLLMGAYTLNDRRVIQERLERVHEIFPLLQERRNERAGQLSGGQQKMVEMGRALMLEPSLMLLDEPSLGLEPRLSRAVFEKIKEVNDSGTSMLIVEQNARRGLEIADRGYVLELGQVRLEGEGQGMLEDPEIKRLYLGGA
ncbi:MAG: ABC transporter ATP-binding protein [Anaerolineae bacterium]